MKIRTFRSVLNHVYKISVFTEDWSQSDLQLMAGYGEPEVELGGSFSAIPSTGGSEATDAFTLPTRTARIARDLHRMTQTFDYRDNENSLNRAVAWETAIVARITSLVTDLRSDYGTEQFSSESVSNVAESASFTAEEVHTV